MKRGQDSRASALSACEPILFVRLRHVRLFQALEVDLLQRFRFDLQDQHEVCILRAVAQFPSSPLFDLFSNLAQ
jgi:hypothetical protein